MKPEHPCPTCGGLRFVLAPRVKLDIGGEAFQQFSLRVCLRCKQSDLFLDTEHAIPLMKNTEEYEVPDPKLGPYR